MTREEVAAAILRRKYGPRKRKPWIDRVMAVTDKAAKDKRPGTYVQRLVRAVLEMKR